MNAIELLKNKGLKKTAQRVLLINILQKKGIALTEEEIKLSMGDLYDRITFYRTAQILIEADIIHRISIDKTVKYALNETCCHGKNHVHFFCKKCHSIICLQEQKLSFDLPDGCTQDNYEILIKGICKNCKK